MSSTIDHAGTVISAGSVPSSSRRLTNGGGKVSTEPWELQALDSVVACRDTLVPLVGLWSLAERLP